MKKYFPAEIKEENDTESIDISSMSLSEIAETLDNVNKTQKNKISKELDFSAIFQENEISDVVIHIMNIAIEYRPDIPSLIPNIEPIIQFFIKDPRNDEILELFTSFCRLDQRCLTILEEIAENHESFQVSIGDIGLMFANLVTGYFYDNKMTNVLNIILKSATKNSQENEEDFEIVELGIASALNSCSIILSHPFFSSFKEDVVKVLLSHMHNLMNLNHLKTKEALIQCIEEIDKNIISMINQTEIQTFILQSMFEDDDLFPMCARIVAKMGKLWNEIGMKLIEYFLTDLLPSVADINEEKGILSITLPYIKKRAIFWIFAVFFNENIDESYFPIVISLLVDIFIDKEDGINAMKFVSVMITKNPLIIELLNDEIITNITELSESPNEEIANAASFIIEQIDNINE